MLRSSLVYSPLTLTDEAEVSVKLKLLAGHNLGAGDIVVELRLHGHPLDETSCKWESNPATGPHPHWPESEVMLTVRRPQLAVLEVDNWFIASRDTVVVASSPAHSVICLHALSKSDRLHIHTFSLC